MPSFPFSVLLCKCIITDKKKYAFRCRRCGSATAPLLRWKMNPCHLYLLSSSASLGFFLFAHVRPAGSLSLHPRGELQRPLLSSCFSHSFHFPWLCLHFVIILCSWHSLTLVPFSGFLLSSQWPLQTYPHWGTEWYWQLYFWWILLWWHAGRAFPTWLHNRLKCRCRGNMPAVVN